MNNNCFRKPTPTLLVFALATSVAIGISNPPLSEREGPWVDWMSYYSQWTDVSDGSQYETRTIGYDGYDGIVNDYPAPIIQSYLESVYHGTTITYGSTGWVPYANQPEVDQYLGIGGGWAWNQSWLIGDSGMGIEQCSKGFVYHMLASRAEDLQRSHGYTKVKVTRRYRIWDQVSGGYTSPDWLLSVDTYDLSYFQASPGFSFPMSYLWAAPGQIVSGLTIMDESYEQ